MTTVFLKKAAPMFGPLKYLFYMLILAILAYMGLYAFSFFANVEQVQTSQEVILPKPQLVNNNQ